MKKISSIVIIFDFFHTKIEVVLYFRSSYTSNCGGQLSKPAKYSVPTQFQLRSGGEWSIRIIFDWSALSFSIFKKSILTIRGHSRVLHLSDNLETVVLIWIPTSFLLKIDFQMAHFQLEQELQAALRLDTTINFNTSTNLNRSSRQMINGENDSAKKRARSAGRSNSSLLNGSLNRSRVLGLQQPQAAGIKRSTSTGRLAVSPGRYVHTY